MRQEEEANRTTQWAMRPTRSCVLGLLECCWPTQTTAVSLHADLQSNYAGCPARTIWLWRVRTRCDAFLYLLTDGRILINGTSRMPSKGNTFREHHSSSGTLDLCHISAYIKANTYEISCYLSHRVQWYIHPVEAVGLQSTANKSSNPHVLAQPPAHSSRELANSGLESPKDRMDRMDSWPGLPVYMLSD